MTNDRRASAAKRLGLFIAGFSLLLALLGIFLFIRYNPGLSASFVLVNAVVYSLIGALIITRQLRHTVGWLFLFVGLLSALLMLGGGLENIITFDDTHFLYGSMAWIGGVLFLPPLLIPLTLVLQFFPDGRLPSRLWWPIPAASLFGILGIVANVAFLPGPLVGNEIPGPDNPFSIPGSERFLTVLSDVAEVALAIGVTGALLILAIRFRRSGSIQRTQMKWLFYTAIVGLSALLLSGILLPILGISSEALSEMVFVILPSLLAIAIGIAILRHQLFDIDVIIRRTLQYAILTGILAGIYLGLVVSFQALFAAVGDIKSEIFIVISTLVIAGLFNPVRKRVQLVVDRRFYRQKYHSQQILAQFAAIARDEVDLDQIVAALMSVIEETMQPERAALSLLKKEKE